MKSELALDTYLNFHANAACTAHRRAVLYVYLYRVHAIASCV